MNFFAGDLMEAFVKAGYLVTANKKRPLRGVFVPGCKRAAG